MIIMRREKEGHLVWQMKVCSANRVHLPAADELRLNLSLKTLIRTEA